MQPENVHKSAALATAEAQEAEHVLRRLREAMAAHRLLLEGLAGAVRGRACSRLA